MWSVDGSVTDRHGTEGPLANLELGSRLEEPGAVVSGQVLEADGTPVNEGSVVYTNYIPGGDVFGDIYCAGAREVGFAEVPLQNEGRVRVPLRPQG